MSATREDIAPSSSSPSSSHRTRPQRGVIYFSSVPPDIQPQEIRGHFSPYGQVGRMKFVPFPKKERRPGGPLLPLRFKEGWMEFYRKEDAINAAAQMNLSPVAVRRTRKCYGRLWNVKYLPDFEWGELAESREEDRRLRRANLLASRSEEQAMNEQYRRLALQKMRKRPREKKEEDAVEEGSDAVVVAPSEGSSEKKKKLLLKKKKMEKGNSVGEKVPKKKNKQLRNAD